MSLPCDHASDPELAVAPFSTVVRCYQLHRQYFFPEAWFAYMLDAVYDDYVTFGRFGADVSNNVLLSEQTVAEFLREGWFLQHDHYGATLLQPTIKVCTFIQATKRVPRINRR